MRLYHAGFQEIRRPDVHYGRRNADFGQGFYLSPDLEFSKRWARARKGRDTYVNSYVLRVEGLHVARLDRDETWFDYIFNNRAGGEDCMPKADVVMGPIANDTIYNVWGITTSGRISRAQALRLLTIGPCYQQVVLKTERAASQLEWLSARRLEVEEMDAYRALVRQEEEAYQQQFVEVMEALLG
ncbi:MAG: DUF3990 domain-containing protein [Clostridia bacterium]|nr:DUF3990 domain-containing protein [Clostridia bacterium]